MKTMNALRAALLCSVGVVAIFNIDQVRAAPAAPSAARTAPASATPAGGDASQGIAEVVVTARKRAERLQKVPISVTAFTAADLAHDPVRGLPDIQKQTPNITFRSGATDPFGGSVAIRGQYADNNDLVSQPSVGVYIDDVYQAISLIGPGSYADVSQIEVLKGAQGTLYGRNSTGGAIKISTPIPNYDGINGRVKFGYGDYNQNEEFGAINIPIIDGKIAMRASYERYATDGYGHFINQPDLQAGNVDSQTGNIAFRFNPIDKLQIVLRGDLSYSNSNNLANNILALNPLASGGSTLALNYGIGSGILSPLDAGVLFGAVPNATPQQIGAAQFALFKSYQALSKEVIPGGSYNAYTGFLPKNGFENPEAALRNDGTSLNMTYDINDDMSVKSVTAYRKVMRLSRDDLFGSTVPSIVGNQGQPNYDEVTQEFQLNGRVLDQKLKYTLGYYYYSLDGTYLGSDVNLPYLTSFFPDYDGSHLNNVSNSFYGQGTYALTDKINFTGGLRWTSETDHQTIDATKGNRALAYTSTGINPLTGTSPYLCKASTALLLQTQAGPLLPGQSCNAAYGASFRNTSYTGGLDWSPTDNLLLYIKTSRGFKAGGVNSNGFYNSFQPEISTDYEAGLKSDWLEHKLRINTAVFTTDYNQIQRPLLIRVNGDLATEVINAASASIDGTELEITARPIQNVEIRASGAYLFAQYNKFTVPDPNTGAPVDISGHRFSDVPRWHTTLSGAYTYPFDFGDLRSSLDWTYTSAISFSTDQPYTGFTNGQSVQNGMSLFDARVALTVDKYDLEVALWARNLLDKKYLQSAIDLSGLLGATAGSLAPPRTFGFEITKRF